MRIVRREGPSALGRRIVERARQVLRGQPVWLRVPRFGADGDSREAYRRWVSATDLSPRALSRLARRARELEYRPVVTVIVLGDEGAQGVGESVGSIERQVYRDWEILFLASETLACRQDAGGPANRASETLACRQDAGGPATVGGELVAVLEPGDTLSPAALLECIARFDTDRHLDLVYADEDRIDGDGNRDEPFFKPGWSPDLLLSTNYIGSFAVFRRDLLDLVELDEALSSADPAYALWLRLTEHTQRVGRVPSVLVHQPADKKPDDEATRAALETALRRRGVEGRVAQQGPSRFAVRYAISAPPLVSVIVPTRNNHALLERCIHGLVQATSYEPLELVVIDNGSTDPASIEMLAELSRRRRVIRSPGPFNYSRLNNLGASKAAGDLLLFLNDDVEPLEPDWLTALVEQARRDEVGAVGAKLVYPNGRIQHAGVVLGLQGLAGHAFRGSDPRTISGPPLHDVIRNCSAVTGACMMVSRRAFEAAGGFDENLAVVYSDVDLCLELDRLGFRVVYTPCAELLHHEGASRGNRGYPDQERRFFERWEHVIRAGDRFYNPNLSLSDADWRVG